MSNLHKMFMDYYPTNNSKKGSVIIPAIRQQLKPIFIFPIISLTLSCHSNQIACATATTKKKKKKKKKKRTIFVEASAMNSSAKFQLYSPYKFWGVDFLIFSQIRKFNLSVVLATNQIERFGSK